MKLKQGLKAHVSILLTQNQVALIDLEDYPRISIHKWCVIKVGQHAKYFYALRNKNGKNVLLHREILNLPKGRIPLVDHINGNGLDNRKSNLRVCSNQENSCNQAKRIGKTTSRFKGVCWAKWNKKWCARRVVIPINCVSGQNV